jgi:hypothetical protein
MPAASQDTGSLIATSSDAVSYATGNTGGAGNSQGMRHGKQQLGAGNDRQAGHHGGHDGTSPSGQGRQQGSAQGGSSAGTHAGDGQHRQGHGRSHGSQDASPAAGDGHRREAEGKGGHRRRPQPAADMYGQDDGVPEWFRYDSKKERR